MRRKRSNWVSVSHLSAYAADPSKFCQHRGQAYNSEAANAGLKAHARAGSGNSLLPWLVIIAVAILVAINWDLL
ncbi:hypothetical protein [Vibrio penaeicida]|uniref:hypothetical protein n=1 Tax=Vibrio penaeicida TaxID=104609 RepID=UPI0008137DCB|nr:hypothetical protein [Vibrio penaeicida]OCQ07876.1 hypothetical protein AKH09_11845 [Vibrio parahaemolyticus]TOA68050.1 hypothetical protein CGK21_19025 [Vibrio parahaemolyticus]